MGDVHPERLGRGRTLGGVSEDPFSHLCRGAEGPRCPNGEELSLAALGMPWENIWVIPRKRIWRA